MTIPIPLTVTLTTSKSTRRITSQLRSLRFREVALGGFASAELAFDRPLTVLPEEIGYFATLKVFAGSKVEFEGRIEDFGRTAGADGVVWELTAMGPSAHAKDTTFPVVYVDTSLNAFVRVDNGTPGGQDSVSSDPGDASGLNEALVLQFPDGLHVNTTSRVVARYNGLMETGQKLARADYTWDTGMSDANFLVQGIARTNGSTATGDVARSDTSNPAGGGSAPKVIVTHWANTRNTYELRVYRTAGGAATLPSDIYWASFRNVVIQGTRYSAAGTELLTAADYGSNTVLASQIFADLLGRALPSYDGANATIETTSYGIGQLVYLDGTTAQQVIDDLLVLEPAYRWGAYESNSAGKNRVEFKSWPTSVRYEADVKDGIYSPASAGDLWNACRVRWRDARGQVRSTLVTSSVPALTAAGLTRTYQLDLGDNVGSSSAATQAGNQFLAEHATPPNAGTLTIARPILDLRAGRMVQPYSIKAGELIRVRGILPSVDGLNASSRDGATIFQIWAKDYDTASAAARLELDSPARTQAQLTAFATQPVPLRRR